jgi:fructose-bisphosphate aldolase class I
VTDLYEPLTQHERVERVVALSGGYPRQEACRLLAMNQSVIASFSRALINGLRAQMSDAEFDAELGNAIEEIYTASVQKV